MAVMVAALEAWGEVEKKGEGGQMRLCLEHHWYRAWANLRSKGGRAIKFE